jgi:eukaryotic-like serine/threonine-protein kinase
MALAPGTKLGPYEIVSLLGSGGMGDVYRARDPRLGRDVAIKILPSAYASDPDRLRRFEHEARAAAALNHPNIVTVYSVEKSDGVVFLTMEVIEGRSLASAIPKNGFSVNELLTIVIPLVDAVAAAHEKGITHRDLKPANIMIGPGGRIKVLDFGLAKLIDPTLGTAATTMPASPSTAEGRIVGTVAYMSPEQAAGKAIDSRTDLFSLGVILYEMATGLKPFKGNNSVSILSSILKDTPTSVTDLNHALPSELGRITRRCLVKDPARRYQTAADLRNELEELKQDLDSGALVASRGAAPVAPSISSPRWKWVAAIIALAVVSAAAYAWLRPRQTDNRPTGGGERVFTQLTTQPGREQFPSLSPDGKWIVYDGNQAGNSDIYLQSVGGQNPINLTKDSPDDDTQPAFSPDGETIAFRSERQGGGIFVMGRTGESVRRITNNGYTPAWSPDGTQLVFATKQPNVFAMASCELWILTLASGERRRLSDMDGIQPSWSPHGHRIAYWTVAAKGRPTGQRDIYTIAAEGGTPVPVTSDAAIDWNPVWAPDGRYLYFASNRGGSMNLWQVAIDERSGRVLGQPEPLTTPSAFAGHLSVSADGRRVVYTSFQRTAPIQKASFDPVSGAITANPLTVVGGSRFLSSVAPSPDGQWLAYYVIGNQLDILISRSDGTGERELTHDPANDRNPTWSRDGRQIAIYSNRSGKGQIWSIKPDGSELRQLTFAPEGLQSDDIWSPDGLRMVYIGDGADADRMFVFEPARPWKDQKPQSFSRVIEPGVRFNPSAWSPDGKELLGDAESPIGSFNFSFGGVFTYSFASGRFSRLSDTGQSWAWLNDSRRVLFSHQGRLFVVDTISKKSREILSVAPDGFGSVTTSADNRTLYFTRETQQGDIWLMTFK